MDVKHPYKTPRVKTVGSAPTEWSSGEDRNPERCRGGRVGANVGERPVVMLCGK